MRPIFHAYPSLVPRLKRSDRIHFDPPKGRPLGVTPWYRIAANVLRPILNLVTTKDWRGAENIPGSGGVIIVCNHISYLDPLSFTHFLYNQGRAPRYLGKKSIFDFPIIGWIVTKAGQIPVDRESSNAAKAFDHAVEALQKGHMIGIYPEGTLTRDPELWPMTAKTGAARLALLTGVPLIPCASWGPQQVIPRYGKKIRLFPRTRISIIVGKPVDLSPWKGMEHDSNALQAATNEIMNHVTELLEQLRERKAPSVRFDMRKSDLPRTGNFVKKRSK